MHIGYFLSRILLLSKWLQMHGILCIFFFSYCLTICQCYWLTNIQKPRFRYLWLLAWIPNICNVLLCNIFWISFNYHVEHLVLFHQVCTLWLKFSMVYHMVLWWIMWKPSCNAGCIDTWNAEFNRHFLIHSK